MSESPRERREQARVRRRWLTLGELLAIAGVAISGLALWNSYRERTVTETRQVADAAAATQKAVTLVLKATPDKEGRLLTLAPLADAQAIQSQLIHFPSDLGLSAVETSGDARIERGWVEEAVVKARKAAGARPETAGDARVPLLIVTSFLADGEPHVDRAVYELGYRTEHGLLSGTTLRLRGLSRDGAVTDEAAGQRRVDALWHAWVARTEALAKK